MEVTKYDKLSGKVVKLLPEDKLYQRQHYRH